MSCLKTSVILGLWSEMKEKNSIKKPLSLCLYQFLKDCVDNCIKNYELFQKIKMFSEINTEIKPAGKLISVFAQSFYLLVKSGMRWWQNWADITSRFGVFLQEVCFTLEQAPRWLQAVPPSWLLLMAFLSLEEAVVLGKPICFNTTNPCCR